MTLWACLGTLGATGVLALVVATGHPLGNQFTTLIVVLLSVGALFSIMCLTDDAQRRFHLHRCVAWLNIGTEFVTVEDQACREQKWLRNAITSVGVHRRVVGDIEPGNSQVFYEVKLTFRDGSSFPLWGRATRDDFPLFRLTEYDEENIRSAVTWLSTTIGQALRLEDVGGSEMSIGEKFGEPTHALEPAAGLDSNGESSPPAQ